MRRLWNLPLWAHAVVLAIGLAIVLPLSAPTSSFTSDEGAYAAQADALRHGRWNYEYPLARLDASGERFPLILTPRGDDGRWYPYVHHPLWPTLLAGASSVLGEAVGLHALGLVGVVVAAAAAWLLATEIDPRASRSAFWLVAASPVAVNGLILWAHAPSAAAAGIALLAAVRLSRDGPTVGRIVALTLAVAAGVLLRSEGLLLAGAVAVTMVIVARRVRLVTALPLVAGGVAWLAERRWVAGIVEGYAAPERTGGAGSLVGGRIRGAVHVLFDGSYLAPRIGVLLLIAALVLVLLVTRDQPASDGIWVADSHPNPIRSRAAVVVGAVAAAGLIGVRWALGPDDPAPGLLVAWPVPFVAAVRFLRSDHRPPPAVVALLAGAGVFAAAVLATQYAEGGGFEWGGRFLSPLVVPVAVAGAAALVGLPRPGLTALAGVAALGAAMGIGVLTDRRHDHDRLIAAVERAQPAVVVTDVASLPRLAWRTHADVAWWLVAPGDIDAAVADLERAGCGGIVTARRGRIENIRSKSPPWHYCSGNGDG